MYKVSVQRCFVAQHTLLDGNQGPENRRHSHFYRVEAELEAETLGKYGYVIDVVDVKHHLDAVVGHFKDRTLNETPELEGINPSLEHFARIFCQMFARRIRAPVLTSIAIKLWEDDLAWASYRQTQ